MLRHYKERNDMKKGELKFALQRWLNHLAVRSGEWLRGFQLWTGDCKLSTSWTS